MFANAFFKFVWNLYSNACKFTPAGGKLVVTTRLILPSIQASTETDTIAEPCREGLDVLTASGKLDRAYILLPWIEF